MAILHNRYNVCDVCIGGYADPMDGRKNTVDRTLFSHHFDSEVVIRPKTLPVEEFCKLLKPGTVVLDRLLQILARRR